MVQRQAIILVKLRDKLEKHKGKLSINFNAWGLLNADIQDKYRYDIDLKPQAGGMIVDLNKDNIKDESDKNKKKLKDARKP